MASSALPSCLGLEQAECQRGNRDIETLWRASNAARPLAGAATASRCRIRTPVDGGCRGLRARVGGAARRGQRCAVAQGRTRMLRKTPFNGTAPRRMPYHTSGTHAWTRMWGGCVALRWARRTHSPVAINLSLYLLAARFRHRFCPAKGGCACRGSPTKVAYLMGKVFAGSVSAGPEGPPCCLGVGPGSDETASFLQGPQPRGFELARPAHLLRVLAASARSTSSARA